MSSEKSNKRALSPGNDNNDERKRSAPTDSSSSEMSSMQQTSSNKRSQPPGDDGDDDRKRPTPANSSPTRCESPNIDVTKFERIRVLGKGGFATVYQAKRRDDLKIFALKVTDCTKKAEIRRLEIEKFIMLTSRCPFICRMFYAITTLDEISFVLEYIPGEDLNSILKKSKVLSEEISKFYVAEITIALEYLHNRKVIYNDLKPSNVMIVEDGHIKLIDFGLSKMNVPKGVTTKGGGGSPFYMSPEIVQKLDIDHSVDLWSLGCVFYEMITGSTPFEATDFEAVYRNILYKNIKFPDNISFAGKCILYGLLNRDTQHRLTIEKIKACKYFMDIDWEKLKNREVSPPSNPYVLNNSSDSV